MFCLGPWRSSGGGEASGIAHGRGSAGPQLCDGTVESGVASGTARAPRIVESHTAGQNSDLVASAVLWGGESGGHLVGTGSDTSLVTENSLVQRPRPRCRSGTSEVGFTRGHVNEKPSPPASSVIPREWSGHWAWGPGRCRPGEGAACRPAQEDPWPRRHTRDPTCSSESTEERVAGIPSSLLPPPLSIAPFPEVAAFLPWSRSAPSSPGDPVTWSPGLQGPGSLDVWFQGPWDVSRTHRAGCPEEPEHREGLNRGWLSK